MLPWGSWGHRGKEGGEGGAAGEFACSELSLHAQSLNDEHAEISPTNGTHPITIDQHALV